MCSVGTYWVPATCRHRSRPGRWANLSGDFYSSLSYILMQVWVADNKWYNTLMRRARGNWAGLLSTRTTETVYYGILNLVEPRVWFLLLGMRIWVWRRKRNSGSRTRSPGPAVRPPGSPSHVLPTVNYCAVHETSEARELLKACRKQMEKLLPLQSTSASTQAKHTLSCRLLIGPGSSLGYHANWRNPRAGRWYS